MNSDPRTSSPEWWHLWLPVVLGALAVYLLLPRPRNYSRVSGGLCAAAAILSAGWLLVRTDVASTASLLFLAFSFIAIASGGMMLAQSNPVYAALSFALVVLSTCGLFLLQAAPFLMAATIIVYAGAIVVTFLFVIMLAQQAGRSDADHRSREPMLATIAGFVLLGALLYLLNVNYDTSTIEAFLARVRDAGRQPDVAAMTAAVVRTGSDGEHNLFDEFAEVPTQPRGFLNRPLVKERVPIEDYKVAWEMARANDDLKAMQKALDELDEDVSRKVLARFGSMQPSSRVHGLSPFSGGINGAAEREIGEPAPGKLPAENPPYLGRTLFTDFLIAVELAGVLLLVAAIGAIAITHRRAEDVR
jgi:NADH:ubiquinone oxidoreductase subunit 6 (subunit J)